MKRLIPLACLLVVVALFASVETALAQETSEPITTTVTIPFLEEWSASPHADFAAEAFIHWNESIR